MHSPLNPPSAPELFPFRKGASGGLSKLTASSWQPKTTEMNEVNDSTGIIATWNRFEELC
jgi:hypothetical protein